MCNRSLRSMFKPGVLKIFAIWECVYWSLLGALVWAKYWKLDLVEVKDDIYDKSEKPLKEKENEFAEAKEQWEKGLYLHVTLCLLFVPAALLLHLGLRRKSRCLIVSWILCTLLLAIIRVFLFAYFNFAYRWFRWFEIYHCPARLYFTVVAGLLCLDVWSAHEDGEPLDAPMILPMDDGAFRSMKGGLNYPIHPSELDVRPTIVGYGMDPSAPNTESKFKVYPTLYETVNQYGQTTRVVDIPPYENL